MRILRSFTAAYFSVFGILLYFQLNWAQFRGRYNDIFFRVFLAFIISAPLLYLLLQLVHLIRKHLMNSGTVSGSALLLYPFTLFHLKWLVYVSEQPWKSSTVVIAGAFIIAETIVITRILRRQSPPAAGATVSGLSSFSEVNRFLATGIMELRAIIHRALTGTITIAGIDFYPATWLLLSMQALLFIKYAAFSFPHPWLLPIGIAASILLPALLVHAVNHLTTGIRFAGNIITALIGACYYLLTLYHITEGAPFDLSILRLNTDLLTHAQSWIVLADRLTVQSYLFTLYCIGAGILIQLLRKSRKHDSPTAEGRFRSGAVAFAVYLLLFLVPLQCIDPPRSCYHSARRYAAGRASLIETMSDIDVPYPYLHPIDSSRTRPDPADLPNILMICLESFNGLLVEDTIEDGREITPFFNSLIPQGVYIEHFYGNSVQTARGFFGLMTGVYPGFGEKESTAFPDLSFRGLPAILGEYGYTSLFIKAYHDISYDNTGDFMKKAGFTDVRAITEDLLTEEEKTMRWGWGLQDDYFYRKCFLMLDDEFSNTAGEYRRRPLFLTTFNVSHHMMFQSLPDDRKRLYPHARKSDFAKNFRNSMFFADSCLRELFSQIDHRQWLENSIIIITGDHSFPSGRHSTKNEKGTWEENFRTPLLILWKDHITPQRMTRHAYSQVDLMPTLFDLLQIAPAYHSVGTSIFSPGPREPVLLSQPYDGISLVSIQYPFKYIHKMNGGTRVLYHLGFDPDERSNVLSKYANDPMVASLQNGIHKLMINQLLIEQNRLWP